LTEHDSESPRDVPGIPSISSGDRTITMVTTPVLPSNVNAHEAPDDQSYLALEISKPLLNLVIVEIYFTSST
jgi:hypothetical protein